MLSYFIEILLHCIEFLTTFWNSAHQTIFAPFPTAYPAQDIGLFYSVMLEG